jgi:dynein heavy chain 1, cytosolic
MAELEHSLSSCKKELQIEDVDLPIHPEIVKAQAKAVAQGKVVQVEDLGALANDRDFLNTLQNGVNLWIKNIQKVTKLPR